MKKLISISIITLLLTGFASCKKYLDQVPDDRLTLEETFSNRGTTEKFLNNVYSNIPNEWGQRNPGGDENAGIWTGASDEGEFLWGFVQSNDYNIGSWDGNSGFVGDFWRNYYRGIRNATTFIQNVSPQAIDMTPSLATQYTAEARALRAMFYFYLMRNFGPVILLGEEVLPPDASLEQVVLPRSTFDECVNFVVSELEIAGADLPVAYNNANYGRITKGIASAFKAQTLLLAASPLFNGNTDYAGLTNKDGTVLINQTFDPGKWSRAATAYKEFLTQFYPSTYDLFRVTTNGQIDGYLSTRDVFLNDWNKEVILARPAASLSGRQYEMTPYHNNYPREVKGSGGLGATQRQVDAFFMANGKPIEDPASGYVTTGYSDFILPYDTSHVRSIYNQWVNREPRFYTNITFDGSVWLNTNNTPEPIVTELWNHGNSGKQTGGGDYSPTGYIVRKAMGLGNWDVGGRALILYRLANIFLDYAEALNEADPANPEALQYVNLIRERAGIPQYGSADLTTPVGQDGMRTAIRRERQVELAFENVRFFDTRRWKIATTTDNGPMIGLNISQDLPAFLTPTPFETRVFAQRHYLWPIPFSDVNINNLLVQNPGW